MNKKTVVIVSEHYGKWGAERSTCSLASYLRALGNRVIVIIPHPGEIIDMLEHGRVEYRVHFFKGWVYYGKKNYLKWFVIRFTNWFQLHRLESIFISEDIHPDIIYSNTLVHGFGIDLARRFKVPHIQHIRENVNTFKMHFYKGYADTLNYINRYSEKVICTCKSIFDRYSNDIDNYKLTYIYNGVPICKYKVKTNPNRGCLRLLYVGRLGEDKRPQDILKAICKLINDGSDNLILDIYGEGPLEYSLKRFVKEQHIDNHVNMKGFSNNIPFDDYDIGLIASTFEAFARTTLEYMMHGLAVVGSNSGGNCEQIVEGETGLLYRTHDADDMADKIQILYKNRDLCLKMGQQGRKRVEKVFSQERYVKGITQLFEEVCTQ